MGVSIMGPPCLNSSHFGVRISTDKVGVRASGPTATSELKWSGLQQSTPNTSNKAGLDKMFEGEDVVTDRGKGGLKGESAGRNPLDYSGQFAFAG